MARYNDFGRLGAALLVVTLDSQRDISCRLSPSFDVPLTAYRRRLLGRHRLRGERRRAGYATHAVILPLPLVTQHCTLAARMRFLMN